jgi:hypothetical protein
MIKQLLWIRRHGSRSALMFYFRKQLQYARVHPSSMQRRANEFQIHNHDAYAGRTRLRIVFFLAVDLASSSRACLGYHDGPCIGCHVLSWTDVGPFEGECASDLHLVRKLPAVKARNLALTNALEIPHRMRAYIMICRVEMVTCWCGYCEGCEWHPQHREYLCQCYSLFSKMESCRCLSRLE